jgi:P-type E1-E2 ATPase
MIGTVIVVRPGEKVPIDGVVVEGTSTLNTSALTGESVPREITVDQDVISGCVNLTGLLKIRTTKEFGESTVSKILDLVENSSMKKSKSENFITKFARYYTPAVCYSALALAILPPMINLIMGNPAAWSSWIIRALTFLVISCPCALVNLRERYNTQMKATGKGQMFEIVTRPRRPDMVGSRQDDARIRQWAVQAGIDPARVRANARKRPASSASRPWRSNMQVAR